MVFQLSFDKNGFGIRWLMKVDLPLKKETKPKAIQKKWYIIAKIWLKQYTQKAQT